MFVNPDMVAAAVPDLANIGATISDANAAAVTSTTELLPAAEDEISTAIAGLFGIHAQEYHALVAQAAAFHGRFVQAVSAGAGSYVAAEGVNAAGLLQTAEQDLFSVVNAPAEALLGTPLIGTGSHGPVSAALVEINAAARSTVFEVRAPDEVGLLHRITRSLFEADLDVVWASVSTLGELVTAFYVQEAGGEKVTDGARLDEVTAVIWASLTA